MNFNMNSHRSCKITSKHSKIKSQVETATSSSDYSTCSDNPQQVNMYWMKHKSQPSRESDILAGHIKLNETNSDTVLEDTNISINPLELNLDSLVHMSEDDVYSDCKDFSYNEFENDSTIYLQCGPVLKSKESQSKISNSNSSSCQNECQKVTASESEDSSPTIGTLHKRLITILEEKEITDTTNHIIKDLSLNDPNQNTGQLLAEIIEQDKTDEPNNNFTKKVLFINLDDVVDNQNNKLNLNKTPKLLNNCLGWPTNKKAKDNCNHNTTESFVLWEKFCEASENLASRRSFSFSQLNAATETCSGDDEYSTSCKTLDDMHLSTSSLEPENFSMSYQHKSAINRSKSCESILKEVKHLPHLLYDRFLKCLSHEIERIRKENVVCTCQKSYNKSNKENNRKKCLKKPTFKLTNKIKNVEGSETELRYPSQASTFTDIKNKVRLLPKSTNNTRLSPTATNETRLLSPEVANRIRISSEVVNRTKLSPEITSKNLSQFQTSPKSPIKTPTTPSKSRYFWNKQIVSPVGEYIRGKRQSPFQCSPSKKK